MTATAWVSVGRAGRSYHHPVAAVIGLGLREGEEVRFRRDERRRWQLGHVRRIERDGSVGIVDGKGASRAIPPAHVEVRRGTSRGARAWEPLLDRAARTEQLQLL